MRCVAVVLLGGCLELPPPVVIENMAVLDVVISPSGLMVYAESEAATCASRFPNVGTVVRADDSAQTCEPSLFGCIERITYAGATYKTPSTNRPLGIPAPPSGPTLVLEGCGVSSTVALPVVSLPFAPPRVHGAIIHDAEHRVIDVAWDGDPRAATHLVSLGSSLWSEVHHVNSGSDQFTTPYLGNLVTTVQSLLPGSQRISPHGLVRFWPASDAITTTLDASSE